MVPLLKTARPYQWVKNLFVAAPLIFAHRFDDQTALLRSAIAVASFCLLSSAVYFINDIIDVEKDRAHPVKRNRPIASGALSLPVARLAAIGASVGGLAVGGYLGWQVMAVGFGYLVLNLGYSFALKRVPFVDVGCISLGFLLRVMGGAFAIATPPSRWLMACTALLSLLLGFGKRAHELRVSGAKGTVQREVLGAYPPGVLRALLPVLAVLTLVMYAAYTQSMHAQGLFGTRGLIVTVPFVGFGIFRFLWITRRKLDAESPTDSMLHDRAFVVNLALYAIVILFIISRSRH
jgi:decaprenyl-phosphate phosphoribosyltransferase